jgi:hypothetical protein
MGTYEINFSGWAIVNADNEEEATNAFKEMMLDDYPEIPLDRINIIEEVK